MWPLLLSVLVYSAVAELCPPKYEEVSGLCVLPFTDFTRAGTWSDANTFCSSTTHPGYLSTLAEFTDLSNKATITFIEDLFDIANSSFYDTSFPVWVGAKLVPGSDEFRTVVTDESIPVDFDPQWQDYACLAINEVGDELVFESFHCDKKFLFMCALKPIPAPCVDTFDPIICKENADVLCNVNGTLPAYCTHTCGLCDSVESCMGVRDLWDSEECMRLAEQDFCVEREFKNKCPRTCCQWEKRELPQTCRETVAAAVSSQCVTLTDTEDIDCDLELMSTECGDADVCSACQLSCCEYLESILKDLSENNSTMLYENDVIEVHVIDELTDNDVIDDVRENVPDDEDQYMSDFVDFQLEKRISFPCNMYGKDKRPEYCSRDDACTKWWGFCAKTCCLSGHVQDQSPCFNVKDLAKGLCTENVKSYERCQGSSFYESQCELSCCVFKEAQRSSQCNKLSNTIRRCDRKVTKKADCAPDCFLDVCAYDCCEKFGIIAEVEDCTEKEDENTNCFRISNKNNCQGRTFRSYCSRTCCLVNGGTISDVDPTPTTVGPALITDCSTLTDARETCPSLVNARPDTCAFGSYFQQTYCPFSCCKKNGGYPAYPVIPPSTDDENCLRADLETPEFCSAVVAADYCKFYFTRIQCYYSCCQFIRATGIDYQKPPPPMLDISECNLPDDTTNSDYRTCIIQYVTNEYICGSDCAEMCCVFDIYYACAKETDVEGSDICITECSTVAGCKKPFCEKECQATCCYVTKHLGAFECEPEQGYCIRANGADQNKGVIKLNDINGNTEEARQACMLQCSQYEDATGCEVIWDQSNEGCYLHTARVAGGSGANDQLCWIRNCQENAPAPIINNDCSDLPEDAQNCQDRLRFDANNCEPSNELYDVLGCEKSCCYYGARTKSPFSTGELRLGKDNLLEIYDEEKGWGTVCCDTFDEEDVNVACVQLGYPEEDQEYIHQFVSLDRSEAGDERPVLLDGVDCNGDEASLLECEGRFDKKGKRKTCKQHKQDVLLFCGGAGLEGDLHINEFGIVETYIEGEWGTICKSSRIKRRDAKVMCGQLGFSDVAVYPYRSPNKDGSLTSDLPEPIHFVKLGCDGDESTILKCNTERFDPYTSDCTHKKDLPLFCEGSYQMDKIRNTNLLLEVALFVPGIGPKFGTVCDEGFDENAAHVACVELGFTTFNGYAPYKDIAITIPKIPKYIHYTNVECDGTESKLSDCNVEIRGSGSSCDHSRDILIVCE